MRDAHVYPVKADTRALTGARRWLGALPQRERHGSLPNAAGFQNVAPYQMRQDFRM